MTSTATEIVSSVMAALDRHDWPAAREILAHDFQMEFPGSPPLDRDSFIDFCVNWYGAFPDLEHEITEAFSEGGRVAMRMVMSGTQQGEFMGIPSQGRHMTVDSLGLASVSGGKVTHLYGLPDLLSMMQQLG